MSRFEILHDAGSSLLRSKRVWLIQFVANPLLFALFVGWLLLPVATELHLLLNGLLIVVLAAAALVLHAGTLNFYSDQNRSEQALVRNAFRRAVRNIFAIAACAALLFVLWALLDSTEPLQLALPFYVRSLLPEFIRWHLEPRWFQISLEGIVFAIRWVVIPGLVLPLVVEAANSGFRAFGKPGRAAVKNSAKRVSYWLLLLLAALAGYIAPVSLMDWAPEFKNPTLHLEAISLIARLSASYILAVASWLLVCSIVGRLSRPVTVTGTDAPGNPAA
jgi:membrane-anchored glycerophosphoryl diester phosphodiesterase (GDPDase)